MKRFLLGIIVGVALVKVVVAHYGDTIAAEHGYLLMTVGYHTGCTVSRVEVLGPSYGQHFFYCAESAWKFYWDNRKIIVPELSRFNDAI